MRSAHVTQPESPRPAPQQAEKMKETRARQTKTISTGLEGFIDWIGVVDSEPTKEEEMSSLAAGFVVQMHKWAMGLEGEATSSFGGKWSKQCLLYEGAQKNWAIVSVDSPHRASNDQPALGDCLNEASVSLEEEVSVVSPLNVEEVEEGAPSGVVTALMPLPKPTGARPNKKGLPDRVLLSTYVPLLERIHPSMGMVAPNPEGVLEIVHRWNPFNQAESPMAHMLNLYSNCFQILVAARVEQYNILFPMYIDREAF